MKRPEDKREESMNSDEQQSQAGPLRPETMETFNPPVSPDTS